MNTVLITGAAGNLGHYVVSTFLRNSWAIIACCRNEEEKKLFDGVQGITAIQCDCTNETEVQNAFAVNTVINAVVHLVGGIKAGFTIMKTDYSVFEEMYNLNVKSTFYIIRESMIHMQNKGGSIITIGAKAAQHPEKNKAAYSSAKSSVIQLTMAASEEGKEHNIRCNCIVPGIIKTAANMEWASNGEENTWTLPEDIAETIYYLSSDAGKGVSGAIIPMYGKLPS